MFQFLLSAMPFSFRLCNSCLISYATGRLDLGVINQVNEGLLMVAIMAIIGGILGNEVWTQESVIKGITWAEAFIYPMYVLIVIVSFIQFFNQILINHQSYWLVWGAQGITYDRGTRSLVYFSGHVFKHASYKAGGEDLSLCVLFHVWTCDCWLISLLWFWRIFLTQNSNRIKFRYGFSALQCCQYWPLRSFTLIHLVCISNWIGLSGC